MATYLLVSIGSMSEKVDSIVQAKIQKEDAYKIESGKWLISSSTATSKELSDTLGVTDAVTFFLAPLRGYYGRAQPDIWEWLAAKATKANA